MLNWLASIGHLITGAIQDVKNWVLRIIQAVYSFIDRQLHALAKELLNTWVHLYAFIVQVEREAIAAYTALRVLVVSSWDQLISWVTTGYNYLRRYIDDALSWVAREISRVETELVALVRGYVNWIERNLIDPLIKSVSNIIKWIEYEGRLAYYLITHPDALVTLLGRYLWGSWLGLLKSKSKPIARWLIHSMLGLSHDLADVLETIIAALL